MNSIDAWLRPLPSAESHQRMAELPRYVHVMADDDDPKPSQTGAKHKRRNEPVTGLARMGVRYVPAGLVSLTLSDELKLHAVIMLPQFLMMPTEPTQRNAK